MRRRNLLPFILSTAILLSGCTANDINNITTGVTTSSDAETSSEATTSDSDSSKTAASGSATSESNGTSTDGVVATQVSVNSDMYTDRDLEVGYDEETSVKISLTGDSATVEGDGVEVSDSTITITAEGTYILSGTLTDGMIIIDVEDSEKVQLVLDGVDITSSTSAAIYVRQADKVFITTTSGSENSLSNGGEYVAIDDNNIDAVIFSKDDLTLNGAGTLTINAIAGHGIVSKDDLVVTSGTINIVSESHGLSGKDSVRIANGNISIQCGEDGIHSENDDDDSLGYVYISGGDIKILAGDDGVHAGTDLTIDGGTIDISESYEGLEGLTININAGEITIVSSDDGLNAAGGNDSSGFGGMQNDIFAVTDGAEIVISGGTLYVNASGDGIDSNGNLYVNGGEIYVSGPSDSGNGAIDYNGEAAITGGTLVATGMSGMAENFGETSTQGVMMVTFNTSTTDEVTLTDSDGNELLTWQPEKSYDTVIISTPDITVDSTYTVSAGSETSEVTMDSIVYGSGMGMGGPGQGGRDGFGGKNGDRNGGQGGDMPSDMTPPSDSDGNMPSDMTPPSNSDGNMPTPPSNSNGTSSSQSSSSDETT